MSLPPASRRATLDNAFSPAAATHLAGGAVVLSRRADGVLRVAVATDGTICSHVVARDAAHAWGERVAPLTGVGRLLRSIDLTTVETRTPWLRGEDGPALALLRVWQAGRAEWTLLVEGGAGALAVALAPDEAAALVRWLAGGGVDRAAQEARDAG